MMIPKLVVEVDRDAALSRGFSNEEIQSVLQNAFAGGHVGLIKKNNNEVKIYLELSEEFKNRPDVLEKLYLRNKDGQMVPLKALAHWHETLGTPAEKRVDQLPAVTLNFVVASNVSISAGLESCGGNGC